MKNNYFGCSRKPDKLLKDAISDWKRSKKWYNGVKRRRDSPKYLHERWLSENPNAPILQESLNHFGIGFECEKEKILSQMKENGNEQENLLLQQIMSDLSSILPQRISAHKQFNTIRLLESIINLWATGKMLTIKHDKKIYYEKMKKINPNPKYDPKREDIYREAISFYEFHNQSALDVRNKLEKHNSAEIVLKGKRIVARKITANKNLDTMIEYAKQISYNKALEMACKKSSTNFDLIDLQRGFKEWRKTHQTVIDNIAKFYLPKSKVEDSKGKTARTD